MHVRAGVGGALAALALAAPALAQAPAPAIGNFGGGFVLAPPKDPLGAGNAVLGMRATAGGKLRIEATIPGRCGGGTFPAKAKVAADGRFVARGTSRRRPEPGLRVETTYRVAGMLTASGVDQGTARATTEVRERGRETVRCQSGTVPFKARRPRAELGIGTPGAAPNARYYGITSEKRNGQRRGIVLRVSDGGAILTRALYAVTLRCGKLVFPDVLDTPRRSLTIDAQGRVKDRVRGTDRTARTVTRYDERFSGTLGSTGAKGTLSITERTSSRKTGKLLETCRTGSIKWTAAP